MTSRLARPRFQTLLLVIIASLFAGLNIMVMASLYAQTTRKVEKLPANVPDPGVITTGQVHARILWRAVFRGSVTGVSFGGSDTSVYALTDEPLLTKYHWRDNAIESTLALPEPSSLPGLTFDPTTRAFYTMLAPDWGTQTANAVLGTSPHSFTQLTQLFVGSPSSATVITGGLNRSIGGHLALAPFALHGQRLAVIPLTGADGIAVVDIIAKRLLGTIPTGIAPYAAAIDAQGTIAYVTNWGGRFPSIRDHTATTGPISVKRYLPFAGDPVVVDARGIAATGTVSRINLRTLRVTQTISVGRQPTALVWDERHARLYVADSNDDAVSVIDTRRNTVVRTISLASLSAHRFGIAPLAVVLSHDGTRLFVACAGLNAVTVIRTRDGSITGAIPTDWYPDDLAISPSGKYLAVGTFFGVGAGWNNPHVIAYFTHLTPNPHIRQVRIHRGTVDILAIPTDTQLALATRQVQTNDNLRTSAARRWRMPPITHVVYIIKENRTYDQVLGDVGKGNSDPSLVEFGKSVTPNQHRLASEYVLLDNFYATGDVSADGHQWVTQGNETPYTILPGFTGRSYPQDGSDPLAYSASGFIWNDFVHAKLRAVDFGEFAGQDLRSVAPSPAQTSKLSQRERFFRAWLTGAPFLKTFHTIAPISSLNSILISDYPNWDLSVPDVVRARIFLRYLHQWNALNRMPNLVLVQLPSDHTAGTSPGASTPRAMVADNDYALGQIIEGLSRSSFWKSTAIFIVEDDAQSGVDHVDGHRTVALLVSPYTYGGKVDSTFYAQQSMLKTMEEYFGLHPMTLFDSTANDMRRSFVEKGNFQPYLAVRPQVSLLERNPAVAALHGVARIAAIASRKMNFSIPDAAPEDELNRIIWHATRGWSTPYPLSGSESLRCNALYRSCLIP